MKVLRVDCRMDVVQSDRRQYTDLWMKCPAYSTSQFNDMGFCGACKVRTETEIQGMTALVRGLLRDSADGLT